MDTYRVHVTPPTTPMAGFKSLTPREMPTMYTFDFHTTANKNNNSVSNSKSQYQNIAVVDYYKMASIEAAEEPPAQLELIPCSICSRTFNPVTLKKHINICEKMAKKKRKVFDSKRQRYEGTDLADYNAPKILKSQQENSVIPPAEQPTRSHSKPQLKKQSSMASSSSKGEVADSNAGGVAPSPKPSTSAAARLALKNAKANANANADATNNNASAGNTCSSTNIAAAAQAEKAKPSVAKRSLQPPTEQCPHCERCFGLKAYDRHVEWCKEKAMQVAKKTNENQKAKERLVARTKYKAPNLKTKRSLNREKYSGVEAEDIDDSKSEKASASSTTKEDIMNLSVASEGFALAADEDPDVLDILNTTELLIPLHNSNNEDDDGGDGDGDGDGDEYGDGDGDGEEEDQDLDDALRESFYAQCLADEEEFERKNRLSKDNDETTTQSKLTTNKFKDPHDHGDHNEDDLDEHLAYEDEMGTNSDYNQDMNELKAMKLVKEMKNLSKQLRCLKHDGGGDESSALYENDSQVINSGRYADKFHPRSYADSEGFQAAMGCRQRTQPNQQPSARKPSHRTGTRSNEMSCHQMTTAGAGSSTRLQKNKQDHEMLGGAPMTKAIAQPPPPLMMMKKSKRSRRPSANQAPMKPSPRDREYYETKQNQKKNIPAYSRGGEEASSPSGTYRQEYEDAQDYQYTSSHYYGQQRNLHKSNTFSKSQNCVGGGDNESAEDVYHSPNDTDDDQKKREIFISIETEQEPDHDDDDNDGLHHHHHDPHNRNNDMMIGSQTRRTFGNLIGNPEGIIEYIDPDSIDTKFRKISDDDLVMPSSASLLKRRNSLTSLRSSTNPISTNNPSINPTTTTTATNNNNNNNNKGKDSFRNHHQHHHQQQQQQQHNRQQYPVYDRDQMLYNQEQPPTSQQSKFLNARSLIEQLQEDFRQLGQEASANLRQATKSNRSTNSSSCYTTTNSNSHYNHDDNRSALHRPSHGHQHHHHNNNHESDEMSSLDSYPSRTIHSKLSADSAYGSLSRQRSSDHNMQQKRNTSLSRNEQQRNQIYREYAEDHNYSRSNSDQSVNGDYQLYTTSTNNNTNNNHGYNERLGPINTNVSNCGGGGSGVHGAAGVGGNYMMDPNSRFNRSNSFINQTDTVLPTIASTTSLHGSMSNSSMSSISKMSKFCHECGNKFLIEQAKFCPDCGEKRLMI